MIGNIMGHRITQSEDRLFSKRVYDRICIEYRTLDDALSDDKFTEEEKKYMRGRMYAYSKAMDDLLVRDDTEIRGATDGFNQVVKMLADFVNNLEKNNRIVGER